MAGRLRAMWVMIRWVLWPPPRRPRPWSRLVPALVLALLFIATCLALQALDMVWFVRPWLLGLALLAPWLAHLAMTGYAGMTPVRGRVALTLRLILLGTLVLALAQPRTVRKDQSLSVVFAVDVSASIQPRLAEQALKRVAAWTAAKPEKDQAGLVLFGQDAAVALPPAVTLPLDAGISADVQVGRDGTNLEKALRLSAALLSDGRQGRVVLISDGAATAGELAGVLDELQSHHIAVDVLAVDYPQEQEVWLTRLELPRLVKAGETYDAAVIVQANAKGTGELTLRENGQVIFRQPVHYSDGRNRFAVPLVLRDPGYYEYEAAIEPAPGQDQVVRNNRAIGYLHLKGQGSVLLVTDAQGDSRDWQTLVHVLKQEQREVTVMTSYEMPSDALALLPYDLVIFVNVGADGFAAPQLQALHDAVYHQGAGFLMVGGEHSFGPGGYHHTLVEEVLPVNMDVPNKKIMPAGALVIVLDRSGSMSQTIAGTNTTQQQVANAAAVMAVDTLFRDDWVGVVGFDSGFDWVVPLQLNHDPAGVASRIRAISPGGGTDIYPAAQAAFQGLQQLTPQNVSVRHIILLTDGHSHGGDYPALAQQIAAAGMSITTVAVGDAPNIDLLQALAVVGRGRFYRVTDPKTLPKVFIKEAVTLRRTLIQNKTIAPQTAYPSPVLKGIEGVPPLHGYVLTTPKPRSLTVLQAPDEEETVPIFSQWRYGVGQAAAFTSDLSPNWGRDWMTWEQCRALIGQMVVDLSRAETGRDLLMESSAAGGQGIVMVEDQRRRPYPLHMRGRVVGPSGRELELPLEQVSPSRYRARFSMWGEGRYLVVVAATDGQQVEQTNGGFVAAYSDEYLRFRPDPLALRRIVERTGGRELTGHETGEQIFDLPRVPNARSQAVFDWLLILLACLIPLDVAVRRVYADLSLLGNLWARRETRRSETLGEVTGRLLQRKRAVAVVQTSASVQLAESAPSTPRDTTPVSRRPGPQAGDDGSTTSRLLRIKRRQGRPGSPDDDATP